MTPVTLSSLEVDAAQARALAQQALPRYFDMSGATPPDSPWSAKSFLGALPAHSEAADELDIYDVHEYLLFRDFTTPLGDGKVRFVRVAANMGLGTPIVSVGVRGSWTAWIAAAREKAEALGETGGGLLVCYSYPRLGLLFAAGADRYVLDIAELLQTPPGKSPRKLPATTSNLTESSPAAIASNVERWREAVAELSAAPPLPSALQADIVPGITLFPQENPDFCAPACAQMILHARGIDRKQGDLAGIMHTVWTGSGPHGTAPQNEADVYHVASGGTCRGQLDTSPAFASTQAELIAPPHGRPLVGGTLDAGTRHSVVIAGLQPGPGGAQEIFVFDPYPGLNQNLAHAGAEEWRSWSFVSFIYVR